MDSPGDSWMDERTLYLLSDEEIEEQWGELERDGGDLVQ